MTCDEFEELSGAYVLGAVTPEEREAARAHLAGCAKCTRLYQQLRAVVDLLPLSVTQVNPPEYLKERVLAAIREEKAAAQPVQIPSPHPQRRRWVPQLLAIAAVLALVLASGMAAWNVSLQHQSTSLQAQNTSLGYRLTSLQQKNNSLQSQVSSLQGQASLAYAILGNASAQGASGKLIYIPQQNITLLIMEGLPQPKGTQVYQGWLIHGNQAKSIGLLSIQNGIASVAFPGNITGYEMAAVSREPGPSASKNAPKGQVVAVGMLKNAIQTVTP